MPKFIVEFERTTFYAVEVEAQDAKEARALAWNKIAVHPSDYIEDNGELQCIEAACKDETNEKI